MCDDRETTKQSGCVAATDTVLGGWCGQGHCDDGDTTVGDDVLWPQILPRMTFEFLCWQMRIRQSSEGMLRPQTLLSFWAMVCGKGQESVWRRYELV